uniref:Uncharacterized protein n=1 Tax=Salix viminalis TaxID=40686 RepID=A0A6N2MAC5_SALVM
MKLFDLASTDSIPDHDDEQKVNDTSAETMRLRKWDMKNSISFISLMEKVADMILCWMLGNSILENTYYTDCKPSAITQCILGTVDIVHWESTSLLKIMVKWE